MPRSRGSLNKKGKQSAEERIAKRRACPKSHCAESRAREYAQRKLVRRNKQLDDLNQRIKNQRHELHAIGRFAG